jgi:hypothetical protein
MKLRRREIDHQFKLGRQTISVDVGIGSSFMSLWWCKCHQMNRPRGVMAIAATAAIGLFVRSADAIDIEPDQRDDHAWHGATVLN